MAKEKIYILVKNFSGINHDVELFGDFDSAKNAFCSYTGFNFSNQYLNPESENYNEKFSETKIFELDLPEFLKLKKRV